jgi:hypothetical protein
VNRSIGPTQWTHPWPSGSRCCATSISGLKKASPHLISIASRSAAGGVTGYSTTSGYLMVGPSGFNNKSLVIPFRFIERVDQQGIYLTLLKDALAEHFGEPPVIQTVVENRFVPGPHGDMLPQAFEVQVVQNGYDGAPLTVDSVELGNIAERLLVGLVVYDVDGARLGDIAQYDPRRQIFVVEKGIFTPTMKVVPFSAIDRIDRNKFSVYLNVPNKALREGSSD